MCQTAFLMHWTADRAGSLPLRERNTGDDYHILWNKRHTLGLRTKPRWTRPALTKNKGTKGSLSNLSAYKNKI